MRKTYFMRVYDIIIYLFLFAILTVMVSKLFVLLNFIVRSTHESYQICLSHNGFTTLS